MVRDATQNYFRLLFLDSSTEPVHQMLRGDIRLLVQDEFRDHLGFSRAFRLVWVHRFTGLAAVIEADVARALFRGLALYVVD